MGLLKKCVLASSALLFSSAAIAYDSEREYLLSLYHGISVESEQFVEQAEQSKKENVLATETQAPVLEVSFPLADNHAH